MTTRVSTDITKDSAYNAVAPDDFPAMMEVERYGQRSTAFDKIISATHDHFWDPLDKKYIDFSEPGAQEYAANQTREEARHVTGFSKYIQARWGSPLPVGPTLGNLLTEMVNAPEVYKKIVGMQMLVEGLAMGAFASLYSYSHDPVLRHLCQLVMTDEAFHHKFGKIWADRTVPHLTEQERNTIEDWAAECFQTLLFNLANPEQKKVIYAQFDLDWEEVLHEVVKSRTDDKRRKAMSNQTNIFRVLIKTLLKAGIITDRTKAFYATYVDMDELRREGDEMVGDAIAEDGIEYLKRINFSGAGRAASAAE